MNYKDGRLRDELCPISFTPHFTQWTNLNGVMTTCGHLIEIQCTAEKEPFERQQLTTLLDLADKGIHKITRIQNNLVADL